MPILLTCECGKQFQAKEENVGRRFTCPECGRDVVVTKGAVDPSIEPGDFGPAEPRTSKKAIASLILGILSFPCLFFAGLPAIILGAIGLSDIGKDRRRLAGKGLAIAGIVTGSIGSVMSIFTIGLSVALLLPAVQAAREAARRAQCVNNLKQIGLAFHNYESAEGHFPAAFMTDKKGNPTLSWRVAILPFLGEQQLYGEFKLDEPWDSPANRALLARIPLAYRCPSDPAESSTTTRYQAIVGPNTLFDGPDGVKVSSITDGTANTILAVESKTPVEWTRPDDVDAAGVADALGSRHPGVANALFADGSVKALKGSTSAAVLKALTTRDGGEVIGPASY